MALENGGNAPYGASKSVIGIIEQYRERGLPSPVTPDVLTRVGVSSSASAYRVLQSLKLLELLDEAGNPTPTFEDLRKATTEDFRPRFADLLRGVYAEVFAIRDPATDDVGKLRDAFRAFEPHAQQERMVRLFLDLCEYAGIVQSAPRVRSQAKASQDPAKARTPKPHAPRRSEVKTGPPPTPTFAPSATLHPFIRGLLDTLPPTGSEWPDDRREAWIQTAQAVFNMIYERPSADASPVTTTTVAGSG